MEISYQPTEDEFVSAQMQFCSKVMRPNRLLIRTSMAVAIILLSVWVLVLEAVHGRAVDLWDNTAAWLGILLGSYLLVNRYWLAPYRIRQIYRKSPNTSCQRRLVINDEGVRTILPNVTDDALRGAFQKAHDLDEVILLMYSPRQFYLIPKRAFDAKGLDEFRSMLRAKGLLS